MSGTDQDPGFGELRSGNLGVRLAVGEAEFDAVQALRYRVFYEEMGAHPDAATASAHRDRDEFDAVKAMAARAREETERLAERVAALEKRPDGKSANLSEV